MYYKGTTGETADYIFPEFTSDHKYCLITQYDIDNNNETSAIVTNTGLAWDTSCAADHLCRHIKVTIDTATNYTFWIKVSGQGSKT